MTGGAALHDIVVIGASAGGVEALTRIVRDLPADLPAAVLVVLHIAPTTPSQLPAILGRAGHLPAAHAHDRQPLESGRIYVAVPDRHLLVEPEVVRVVRGPRENGHRPAVDPLFRSAATCFGPRVIGVVLSGSLDCGTHGLLTIKRRGGLAVVQDPSEAVAPGMPTSALEAVDVDHCVRLNELGPLLVRLVNEAPPAAAWSRPSAAPEVEERQGAPAEFVCPECSGPLWELRDGKLLRYRCRTGHAYSAEVLFQGKEAALEAALWEALNALDEKVALARRLEVRARQNGHRRTAKQFESRARDAEERAALVRDVLLSERPLGAVNHVVGGPDREPQPTEVPAAQDGGDGPGSLPS